MFLLVVTAILASIIMKFGSATDHEVFLLLGLSLEQSAVFVVGNIGRTKKHTCVSVSVGQIARICEIY